MYFQHYIHNISNFIVECFSKYFFNLNLLFLPLVHKTQSIISKLVKSSISVFNNFLLK